MSNVFNRYEYENVVESLVFLNSAYEVMSFLPDIPEKYFEQLVDITEFLEMRRAGILGIPSGESCVEDLFSSV